jgi:hypothetical protein
MASANTDIPSVIAEERLGKYCRMMDEPIPVAQWTFEKMYTMWERLNYFASLYEMGKCTVSYDGVNYIDFEPSSANANRHQALALSTFVDCAHSNSRTHISVRHERGGTFTALFERVSPTEVKYTNEYGKVVCFRFDSSLPTQFYVNLKMLYPTLPFAHTNE